MAYPPSWRLRHGDVGTATAALLTAHGSFIGYLNLTPRQGAETVAGWPSFRINHNGDEGDQHVHELAASGTLRFRTGSGRCVEDSYTTKTDEHFIELACLITGPKASSVIVGAAPPTAWPREAPVLRRAVEAVEA
jgi:hypothetical protein